MSTSLEQLAAHLRAVDPHSDVADDVALGLLDTAAVLVVVLDAEGRVLYVNAHLTEELGWTLEELRGREWIRTCIPGEAQHAVGARWRGAVEGDATRGHENAVLTRTGAVRHVSWTDRRLLDAEGRFVALLAIGHDVTERRQAMARALHLNRRLEQRLWRETQALQATFQAANVCLAHLDRNFDFVQVNRAYADVDPKGRTPADFPGLNHFELYPNDDNRKIFERVRDTGQQHVARARPFEYAEVPDTGLTHWDWTLSPVLDPGGRVTGLVLALTDVSERITALEEMRRSKDALRRQLQERETLLREVHHRVKNNLQVISSLLDLQSLQPDTPQALSDLLQKSRNRVRAIGLVHEALYAADDIGAVEARSYFQRIATTVQNTHPMAQGRVEVEVDAPSASLPLELAVPCGLILNELLTNALKHGFPDEREGIVRVAVRQDSERFTIRVADDGVGLPASSGDTASGLGLRLVTSLADQLEAELELSSREGCEVRLAFTLP